MISLVINRTLTEVSFHKPASSATALFGISTTDPFRQQCNDVLADVKVLHLYLSAVDDVHNIINRYAVTETQHQNAALQLE